MIIDTEELKEEIRQYYDIAGEATKKIQNYQRSLDILTRLEEIEKKELDYIEEIERLATRGRK